MKEYDIFNKGNSIESELNRVINEAIDKRIALVEIIPGKGSGQLKKTRFTFSTAAQYKKTLSQSRERR